MTLDFRHASIVEGVRFTAQVGVPNVVQGLFRKREQVVSAVGKLPAEHLAYRLVEGLTKKYGPDPFWVRVGTEETLLLTHPEDLRIVLGGSPSPFASDPEAKRKGMAAFQPTALSISRGDVWANRRAFADAVLKPGSAVHPLAGRFAALAVEAADDLLATGEPLRFDVLNASFQRLTRRVVFGNAGVVKNLASASPCLLSLATPSEKFVMDWISAGSMPPSSACGKGRISLTWVKPISASPLATASAAAFTGFSLSLICSAMPSLSNRPLR